MLTATVTRPNIVCTVHAVARVYKISGLAHKMVVLKVMQCMLHTKKRGITYGGQDCRRNMEAYTDSEVWSLPGYYTLV